MNRTAEQQETRERYLIALLEAAVPLKQGADPELALELAGQRAGQRRLAGRRAEPPREPRALQRI